ncbi:hypothetical protein [Sulfitobacter sp. MOLA879]|uniref:hypothetical protein n=1 Tax=Sulfitobacter sp. MOLA879 TaxID=3368579 RepID=UPI0037472ED7
MARIFVDVNMFGESWFGNCLQELIKAPNVRFSYSNSEKFTQENEHCFKALRFYKLVGDMGKRDDAPATHLETHISHLEGLERWQNEAACDDAHIFALVFLLPTPFVLSKDKRMARCRGCINPQVDKKYCQFALIGDRAIYDKHRAKILS